MGQAFGAAMAAAAAAVSPGRRTGSSQSPTGIGLTADMKRAARERSVTGGEEELGRLRDLTLDGGGSGPTTGTSSRRHAVGSHRNGNNEDSHPDRRRKSGTATSAQGREARSRSGNAVNGVASEDSAAARRAAEEEEARVEREMMGSGNFQQQRTPVSAASGKETKAAWQRVGAFAPGFGTPAATRGSDTSTTTGTPFAGGTRLGRVGGEFSPIQSGVLPQMQFRFGVGGQQSTSTPRHGRSGGIGGRGTKTPQFRSESASGEGRNPTVGNGIPSDATGSRSPGDMMDVSESPSNPVFGLSNPKSSGFVFQAGQPGQTELPPSVSVSPATPTAPPAPPTTTRSASTPGPAFVFGPAPPSAAQAAPRTPAPSPFPPRPAFAAGTFVTTPGRFDFARRPGGLASEERPAKSRQAPVFNFGSKPGWIPDLRPAPATAPRPAAFAAGAAAAHDQRDSNSRKVRGRRGQRGRPPSTSSGSSVTPPPPPGRRDIWPSSAGAAIRGMSRVPGGFWGSWSGSFSRQNKDAKGDDSHTEQSATVPPVPPAATTPSSLGRAFFAPAFAVRRESNPQSATTTAASGTPTPLADSATATSTTQDDRNSSPGTSEDEEDSIAEEDMLTPQQPRGGLPRPSPLPPSSAASSTGSAYFTPEGGRRTSLAPQPFHGRDASSATCGAIPSAGVWGGSGAAPTSTPGSWIPSCVDSGQFVGDLSPTPGASCGVDTNSVQGVRFTFGASPAVAGNSSGSGGEGVPGGGAGVGQCPTTQPRFFFGEDRRRRGFDSSSPAQAFMQHQREHQREHGGSEVRP